MRHPRISINHGRQYVRVWKGNRSAGQKYFSIKQYGTLPRALDAAIDYEATMPACQRVGRTAARQHYANSTSGIVGVCPIKTRSGEAAGWRANWTQADGGGRKTRTKDFSFHAYGSKAHRHAIEYRKVMVEKFMAAVPTASIS